MACLRSQNFMSVWIMFLFFEFLCSIGLCPHDAGQSIFLTEPLDVTAKEGDDVSFSCTANSSSYLPIEWELSPDEPVKKVVEQNTTSRLQIYNIGRLRDSYITCKVSLRLPNRQKCLCKSKIAKMTVQYFPRKDELTCSTPDNSLIVQEGDSFHIHCQVDRGNPPIDIGWTMDEHTFRQKPAKDDGLTRTSAQIINVTREMHGQYFVCVVTSKVSFPGEEITCSIGPLDVHDSATHHPATDGTANDHSTNTPNSSPTPLIVAWYTKVTYENDQDARNSIVDLSSLETSSEIQTVSNLTPLFQNGTLVWWEGQEALVVVLAISGSLLAVFLTTMTFIKGINRCKSTERHPTEQGGNNDVEQYHGQSSFPGTTQDDFKVSADSISVKEPEQAFEKVAARENTHQIVLNKNSSQNDHTTRRSLRYSDVWSSISSLSDSSATLEDVANVPLKNDRELSGHVSYGNKFLVDLEDVYVIQKLNSRRSSLGLLFLNPSEPTGELRHFTLPRQSGPISLPITDTTKTDDLRKDCSPSSRNYPTAAAPPQTPQGPVSTSPFQCHSNQHNPETSTLEDTEERYLHEETKL